MGDQLEGTGEGLTEATEATIAEATDSSGPDGESGFNPAWAPIREKIGDNLFQLIAPELTKWDKAAEGRVQSSNAQLAEYKKLGEVPQIQQAMQLAQRIDADPATVHQMLGEFLQKTGRMPNTQETQQIVEQVAAEEDAEEQQALTDPRVDQLAQQQEQMVEFLQQQQFEQEVSRETAVLEQELNDLKSKGYAPEDIQTIYNFTVQLAEQRHRDGDNTPVSLTEGAAQFDALRTRLLTAPRAGDSAPKLLPTSGGSPNGTQQRSMGQLSRQETQELIAARLSGSK